MPYDKSMDKEVFSESVDLNDVKITVSVFSYNNGEAKLQISRQVMRPSGEWGFVKLGRMTKTEAEAILPLARKALESM